MGKLKIAVATNGNDRLEDVVSNVFGGAKTFTIVDVENGKIENVIVMENSMAYLQGAGPIVVQMLVDKGVDMLLANKPNIWAAEQLKQRNITHIQVKPGTNVEKAIAKVLRVRSSESLMKLKPRGDMFVGKMVDVF